MRILKTMQGLILFILSFLQLASGAEASQCYSWQYGEPFYIKEESLAESAVLERVESRSFVECCVECDAALSCTGVAFREGECSFLDGTAAAPEFVASDGSGAQDYKVVVFNAETSGEVQHCVTDCEGCLVGSLPDCKSALAAGYTSDGEYSASPFPSSVYCDMSNGGWTVIQRRVDGSVDFYRGWQDYVSGFGDPWGSYWAGLDKIHQLTSSGASELHVYMDTFEGESAWAQYSSFSVGDAASGYMLSVGGFTGSTGDSLNLHNGMRFTTHDHDQDQAADNCAQRFKGGWWYSACHATNPNGLYLSGSTPVYAEGVTWYAFKGDYYSLKTIEFKIRKQ